MISKQEVIKALDSYELDYSDISEGDKLLVELNSLKNHHDIIRFLADLPLRSVSIVYKDMCIVKDSFVNESLIRVMLTLHEDFFLIEENEVIYLDTNLTDSNKLQTYFENALNSDLSKVCMNYYYENFYHTVNIDRLVEKLGNASRSI